MSVPSDPFALMAYTFFVFESLVGVTVLAVACLNLAVIGPTRLLHPNLKCILITQSVALMINVLDREAMLVEKFFFNFNEPFKAANIVLQCIMSFTAIFRRMLGHALIIERFLATVYTNSYEHFSRVYFNLAWFSLTVSENVKTAKQLFPAFFAIEVTVITHHPLLKRRAAMLLKNIFRFKHNQIGDEPNFAELANCYKDGTIETMEHFKMLELLWNK